MEWRIPLFKIFWDEGDVARVTDAITRGMSWAIGPEVAEFEDKLASYLGAKHCIVLNSGTSALHAVLLASGIGPGDEVIVPSFTFIATANAVLFTGARPVFADIEERTCGLDPEDVQKKITSRTKAVLPVHVAGGPCLIRGLRGVTQKHHVMLIEDAAESLGAEINGVKAGAIGDAAILSFCQNKIITTGEGGAVVTSSDDVYEKLKLVRSHGREERGNYFTSTERMDYVSLGYNFRLSSISAALGIAQLEKIDRIIAMRMNNAARLSAALSTVPRVTVPRLAAGSSHVYQMYCIRVPSAVRDGLRQHLADKGIMSRVDFHPVHRTHFYRQTLKYDCALPVTDKVSSETLTLPMFPTLSGEEIATIAGHVSDYMLHQ